MQNERLQLMCKQLADIQAECMKEGYLLDVPSFKVYANNIICIIIILVYNIEQVSISNGLCIQLHVTINYYGLNDNIIESVDSISRDDPNITYT